MMRVVDDRNYCPNLECSGAKKDNKSHQEKTFILYLLPISLARELDHAESCQYCVHNL